MFTGIVAGCGTVENFIRVKKGAWLGLRPPKKFPAVKIGGSISVNGACLTLVKKSRGILFFDVVAETVRKTNFSRLKKGSRVNLEPALRYNSRVEGHFVQGHVDGTGTVKRIRRQKSDLGLLITFPPALKPYVVEKGSITVNGVSLTVGGVQKGAFWVYLIPHTLKMTGFGDLTPGDRVNLEADVLLKFFRTLHTAH